MKNEVFKKERRKGYRIREEYIQNEPSYLAGFALV
jgi:hypothetical protein